MTGSLNSVDLENDFDSIKRKSHRWVVCGPKTK